MISADEVLEAGTTTRLADDSPQVGVLGSVGGLEVLRARYRHYRYPVHAHAEYVIGAVLKGAERFRYRGRDIVAPSGHILLINPDEAHTGEAAETEWTYMALYPSRSCVASLFPGCERWGTASFPEPILEDRAAVVGIVDFVQSVFQGESQLVLESKLLDLLYGVFSRHASQPPPAESPLDGPDLVESLRARLISQPHENIGLLEFARRNSIPPLRVLRSFRRKFGCTPHIFQTTQRIKRAKELLRAGAALCDVALSCGFSDQSHFTNVFRKWISVTPGQFVKSIRY